MSPLGSTLNLESEEEVSVVVVDEFVVIVVAEVDAVAELGLAFLATWDQG